MSPRLVEAEPAAAAQFCGSLVPFDPLAAWHYAERSGPERRRTIITAAVTSGASASVWTQERKGKREKTRD